MIKLHTMLLALAAGLALFLAGCGGTPYDYSSANDTKPGPGLLSGDDGVFNIVRSKPPAADKPTEQGEPAKSPKVRKTE